MYIFVIEKAKIELHLFFFNMYFNNPNIIHARSYESKRAYVKIDARDILCWYFVENSKKGCPS